MKISVKDIIEDKNKLKLLSKSAFDRVDIDKSGFLEKNEVE